MLQRGAVNTCCYEEVMKRPQTKPMFFIYLSQEFKRLSISTLSLFACWHLVLNMSVILNSALQSLLFKHFVHVELIDCDISVSKFVCHSWLSTWNTLNKEKKTVIYLTFSQTGSERKLLYRQRNSAKLWTQKNIFPSHVTNVSLFEYHCLKRKLYTC